MALAVSTWLRAVRLLQLIGAIVMAGLNGYIIVLIYMNKRGPDQTPLVKLEWLICIILAISAVILLTIHTGKRVRKESWLLTSVLLDLILLGLSLAIFSITSDGGLPDNCRALTPESFMNGRPNYYHYEIMNNCTIMKIFFVINCALLYSFVATVVLTSLVIAENSRHKIKRNLAIMDDPSDEELGCGRKPDDASPTAQSTVSVPLAAVRSYTAESSRRPAPAPPSEGVTSPRVSLMPQQQDSGILPVVPTRKPVAITLDIPSTASGSSSNAQASSSASVRSPTTTQPSSAPSLSTPIPHSPIQLIPGMVSDNSAEMAAAAALTTDGSRVFGREGGGAGFYEPGAGGSGTEVGNTHRGLVLPPPYSPRESPRTRIEDGESGTKG